MKLMAMLLLLLVKTRQWVVLYLPIIIIIIIIASTSSFQVVVSITYRRPAHTNTHDTLTLVSAAISHHRRSQEVQWVHLQPGRRKNWRNLRGKFVSAPPAHQVHLRLSKSQSLGHFCWVGEIWG